MTGGWTLAGLLRPWASVADERAVTALTLDSREVTPGSVFLAIAGGDGHGLDHLHSALAAGAAAVVWEPTPATDAEAVAAACARAGAVSVPLADLAGTASAIAARHYGNGPGVPPRVIGVTGTDGKTSVTQFLGQILDGGAVIGTLGWGRPGALEPTRHTTPDAVTLQRLLAGLRDRGSGVVAMEVSSHALDQARVAAVDFDVAVLTNLGHDHLDYHGSMAAYADAKRRLFDTGSPRPVLNLDDALGRELATSLAAREPVGYSLDGAAGASVSCLEVHAVPDGLWLSLEVAGVAASLQVPLLGRFNAANVLAALGAMLALGLTPAQALERVDGVRPVPGRMEGFREPGRPAVVIDYAHTPAALAAALAATRAHFGGALWVVFGCGGDRDRGKRPLMGRIAAEAADHVVLTSDNPRHEEPAAIIDGIRAGIDAGAGLDVVADRGAAIRHALAGARPTDVVLVAGKGHEDYQIVGDVTHRFSDRDCVAAALREAG